MNSPQRKKRLTHNQGAHRNLIKSDSERYSQNKSQKTVVEELRKKILELVDQKGDHAVRILEAWLKGDEK